MILAVMLIQWMHRAPASSGLSVAIVYWTHVLSLPLAWAGVAVIKSQLGTAVIFGPSSPFTYSPLCRVQTVIEMKRLAKNATTRIPLTSSWFSHGQLGHGWRKPILRDIWNWIIWDLPAVAGVYSCRSLSHSNSGGVYQQHLEWAIPLLLVPMLPPQVLDHNPVTRLKLM